MMNKYFCLVVSQLNGALVGLSKCERSQAATMGHHATGYRQEQDRGAMPTADTEAQTFLHIQSRNFVLSIIINAIIPFFVVPEKFFLGCLNSM